MNKERKALPASGYREVIPYFRRIFLPLAFFFVSATVIYFVIDTRHEKKLILAEQRQQVESSLQSLRRDISGVLRELQFLAHSDSLTRFISSTDEGVRKVMVEDLAAFAEHMGRYEQIRWLDLKGMERLRVDHRNGVTRIVPQRELQDKSTRYYFAEAIALPPGRIYISPLDLNVEHGEVEVPYRPMLRFAMTTADDQGARNGLLILNYQASRMLDNFAGSKRHEHSELALLNADGYWLFASDHRREWGFMFGRDERFQNLYPDVWAAIKKLSHGTVHTSDGLFSFSTTNVMAFAGNGMQAWQENGSPANSGTGRWIVVYHYPMHAFSALYFNHLGLYGVMLGLVLLVLLISSWKLAEAICERNRMGDMLALHAKVMETAPSGVMITDSGPRIVAVNEAFTELTGYSREEVLEQDPSILASGRHDDAYFTDMWQELEDKGHWEGEIWNRHKNGEVFPEWLTISAVRNRDGALTNYIGIFSVLSEQKSTEVRLRELANSDPLTGLPNRNLLYDRAGQALAHSRRTRSRTAFLFLDLDSFKPINDSMGHAAGDEVLKSVAHRLQGCVRESDTVARFGGDEFVVLLTELKEPAEAAEVAEKIIIAINQPMDITGVACHVGVSIGISIYPDDSGSVDELVKYADQAMYHVKESGKGHFKFFHSA